MLEQLEAIKERFLEVSQQMGMPEVVSDMAKFTKISKEYKDLEKIVNQYKIYKEALGNIAGAKDILNTEKDEEPARNGQSRTGRAATKTGRAGRNPERKCLSLKIRMTVKNAILEVRAGTGGDEASIFAGGSVQNVSAICGNSGRLEHEHHGYKPRLLRRL